MFKRFKRFLVPLLLCLALVSMVFTGGCPAPAAAPDPAAPAPAPELPPRESILVGSVSSLSGPLAGVEGVAFGPIRKLWIDDVNARGGIFIEEYGQSFPLELIEYDDTSDAGTMTRLMEKLILEDKVDILLPPTGTGMLHAAAPIANKHGMILSGMSGGASSIQRVIAGFPYFFANLSFAYTQAPAFADLAEALGVQTAAVVFVADLHGVEYSGAIVPLLEARGIDVVLLESIPPGIKDMTPILREAKALNVDAYLNLTLPAENILAVTQAIEVGFNPKLFLTGPGGNFGFFKEMFGENMNGLMTWGAWNAETSPGAAEFMEQFLAVNPPSLVDHWGHLYYWAGLQFLEQAIIKAGTLDNSAIREVMVTERFETVLGPTWYENQLLAKDAHPGQIGQWQDGVFEVIAPPGKATAEPLYPKPAWQ